MWIQNVSAIDFQNARHFDCGENSIGIQICDPTGWIPKAGYKFKEVHLFHFLDTDKDLHGITDQQAKDLVQILQYAKDNYMNVVVHCTAGMCRSGAVTEVGIMMGFNDTEAFRMPNMRVKTKMMKELGWTYE